MTALVFILGCLTCPPQFQDVDPSKPSGSKQPQAICSKVLLSSPAFPLTLNFSHLILCSFPLFEYPSSRTDRELS
ncbi:hypothetical protein DL95DRAFT_123940 [Leptodontidium sp. 2 PMI_412]|nr:hypothetical protein DL95DRAFT_123940 [Leptodontidium sp. 2 PMI_412]